jgi:hypothetical protein
MAATPFDGAFGPLPPEVRAEMIGRSWHDAPGCPRFEELALVRVPHWDFAGGVARGELVVAAEVAADVLRVFARLYEARFPIARMTRIDAFGGDDDASMGANNTSAFNFRRIAGSDLLSQHALGVAVDVNPVQNPMLKDGGIYPPAGRAYLDRADARPGMITRPGPVVAAFEAIGWIWGGDWEDLKDYHHFARVRR